jgi:hypothetical protein
MFSDFGFKDNGRPVLCTRGMPNAEAGSSSDAAWWYISLEGGPPTRLLRVYPGETHREVWEAALRHLDGREVPSPQSQVLDRAVR